MIVPLVDNDQISPVQRFIEIEAAQVILDALQAGIPLLEFPDWKFALLGAEVIETPTIARLINAKVMTARNQIAGDSPQEMGVAMIPVGKQRMVEHHDPHRVIILSSPGVGADELPGRPR